MESTIVETSWGFGSENGLLHEFMLYSMYRNDPNYSDKHVCANIVDSN